MIPCKKTKNTDTQRRRFLTASLGLWCHWQANNSDSEAEVRGVKRPAEAERAESGGERLISCGTWEEMCPNGVVLFLPFFLALSFFHFFWCFLV